ncbi:MAG TPA: hypothetical protein VNC50_17240, partial [Planctomycetia bacterium]|nr:hypothetical protein [Planctomycetia bacterium]
MAGMAPPVANDAPTAADLNLVGNPASSNDPKLAKALEKFRPALAELELACRYPPAMFPHDFGTRRPIALLLPQSQDMRWFARALKAEMARAMWTGEPRKIWAAVLLCFRAAHRLDPEVLHIPKLVQVAIHGVAVEMLAEALGQARPTEEEFAALDAELAESASFRFRESILGERAEWLTALDDIDVDDFRVASKASSGNSSDAWEDWRIRMLANFEASRFGEPERLEEQIWLLKVSDLRLRAIDDLSPAGDAALTEHQAQLAGRRYTSLLAGALVPPE